MHRPWFGGIPWQRTGNGAKRDIRRKILGPQRIGLGASPLGFLYCPFTTVDEKIPLSVVQVNSKPQHLVFSSHFQYQLEESSADSKNTANFAVESANSLARRGSERSKTAQNPVHSRLNSRCLSTKQAYAPQDVRTRSKTSANLALAVGVVDNRVPITPSDRISQFEVDSASSVPCHNGRRPRVLVQSALMSGCHLNYCAKKNAAHFRAAFSLDLQDRNQLLSLVSILIP